MTTLQALGSTTALAAADPGRDLIHVTIRPAPVFTDGLGSWLTDEVGKRHLGLVQGWAVNSLGHSPVVIAEALARQSRRLLNPGPAFHNRPMLDLASRLAAPICVDRVWFGSAGAEGTRWP